MPAPLCLEPQLGRLRCWGQFKATGQFIHSRAWQAALVAVAWDLSVLAARSPTCGRSQASVSSQHGRHRAVAHMARGQGLRVSVPGNKMEAASPRSTYLQKSQSVTSATFNLLQASQRPTQIQGEGQ